MHNDSEYQVPMPAEAPVPPEAPGVVTSEIQTHEEAPAHESGIHIALSAEKLGTFAGIPITNTLVMSWIVMVLLIGTALIVRSRMSMVPGKLQLLVEELITFMKGFMQETLENEKVTRQYLPLLLTIFLFIFTANLLEFTPGIGSLLYFNGSEHVPLLRSMNTDLNVTLSLAIIAVIFIEIAGIATLGFFRYTGKFINFSGHGIGERLLNFVVGIIELVSEVSRLVSFSFRLFGNIFAGEVLLAVASFFVPYILPSGLMAFELFVGFIQAAVFSLLTLFFIKMAITDAHAAH